MDYEEYMRNVLGYNQIPNNIYTNTYNDYYYDNQYFNNFNNNQYNLDSLNDMYPEIYRIVYPMVCRICTQNGQRQITKELIDNMTDEIYRNIEVTEEASAAPRTVQSQLKNGDVRNPNVKEVQEVRSETRQSNFLLRDLIRILIIREFLRPNNRPRPPRPPRPPFDQRPPWRPY